MGDLCVISRPDHDTHPSAKILITLEELARLEQIDEWLTNTGEQAGTSQEGSES